MKVWLWNGAPFNQRDYPDDQIPVPLKKRNSTHDRAR
jgi:hypothetical protein